MRKQIKDDNFAAIIQILIRVHHYHPDLSLMSTLLVAVGMNDPQSMTDEQLLESLELFYAGENRK